MTLTEQVTQSGRNTVCIRLITNAHLNAPPAFFNWHLLCLSNGAGCVALGLIIAAMQH
jgi:hypothetical protein